MTVYIVFTNHLTKPEVYGAYTDLEKAKSECFVCNENDPIRYWSYAPIELTTDSFMESVLTKDNK